MTVNISVFASINNMLIQNKCWLCEDIFQRGKMKRVFQLSDLLEFFLNRAIKEFPLKEGLGGEANSLPPLRSKHLKDCYNLFKSLITLDYSSGSLKIVTDRVFEELKNDDLEVWMSGLVCGSTDICQEEACYFIKDLAPKQKSSQPVSTDDSIVDEVTKAFKPTLLAMNGGKDCPPGCNCDNPWPFLS
jgi:hypothetical protein